MSERPAAGDARRLLSEQVTARRQAYQLAQTRLAHALIREDGAWFAVGVFDRVGEPEASTAVQAWTEACEARSAAAQALQRAEQELLEAVAALHASEGRPSA